jgi:hypothetical protein
MRPCTIRLPLSCIRCLVYLDTFSLESHSLTYMFVYLAWPDYAWSHAACCSETQLLKEWSCMLRAMWRRWRRWRWNRRDHPQERRWQSHQGSASRSRSGMPWPCGPGPSALTHAPSAGTTCTSPASSTRYINMTLATLTMLLASSMPAVTSQTPPRKCCRIVGTE